MSRTTKAIVAGGILVASGIALLHNSGNMKSLQRTDTTIVAPAQETAPNCNEEVQSLVVLNCNKPKTPLEIRGCPVVLEQIKKFAGPIMDLEDALNQAENDRKDKNKEK